MSAALLRHFTCDAVNPDARLAVPRPRRADAVRTASGGGDVTEFDCDDVC